MLISGTDMVSHGNISCNANAVMYNHTVFDFQGSMPNFMGNRSLKWEKVW